MSYSASSVWEREPVLVADYAAATGRIRVLEDRMLKPEEYRRLASGLSYAERADLLERAGYGGEGSLEQRLLAGREQNDLLLKELTHDSLLSVFLLLDLDYHNVKAIVRYLMLLHLEQEASGAPASSEEAETLESGGGIPQGLMPLLRQTAPTSPELLYQEILLLMSRKGEPERPAETAGSAGSAASKVDGSSEDIPRGFRKTFYQHVKQVLRVAKTSVELSATDLLADRLCFEEMLQLASPKEAGADHAFLRDYVEVLADLANLETLFRVRRSGLAEAFLADALVPGGKVTREAILSLYKAEEKEIEKTFANTQVAAVLENFPVYRTKVDIVGFGLKKDEVLYRLARVGKRQTAGVEALTGFWLGKKMEIKNVRIILQALARGLPQEEIQKLLRPTYPGYQA